MPRHLQRPREAREQTEHAEYMNTETLLAAYLGGIAIGNFAFGYHLAKRGALTMKGSFTAIAATSAWPVLLAACAILALASIPLRLGAWAANTDKVESGEGEGSSND